MESAQERLGETLLGKWHLDALLGEGGMALVYAATHRNGARGAVKIPRTRGKDQFGRFTREGYIANRVDHPAIVRVLDDDVTEDGTPFLVMELLEGKALDELAADGGGKLPIDEVLGVMGDVLDALAAAHDRGIVHRDIKPENIFITTDRRVKLLDFGIAHLPAGYGPPSPKTEVGTFMGTPAFMSPEQARARWDIVGPSSDLWSVGATMFTALSGAFVHEEETVPEILAATFGMDARSLRSVLPGAPDPVVRLVDRALEREMGDRWASAREMLHALRAAQARPEERVLAETYRGRTTGPRKWRIVPPRGPEELPLSSLSSATRTLAAPHPPLARGVAVGAGLCGALAFVLLTARALHSEPPRVAGTSPHNSFLPAPSASLRMAAVDASAARPDASRSWAPVPASAGAEPSASSAASSSAPAEQGSSSATGAHRRRSIYDRRL